VRLEILGYFKNPVNSSGIESGTSGLCLSQQRYRVLPPSFMILLLLFVNYVYNEEL
jgi:hypothetical protein